MDKSLYCEKYLPLGSVVIYKGAFRPVMIIGYRLLDNDIVKDYIGTIYPEGMFKKEIVFGFNHDEIKTVLSIGYVDRYFDKIKEELLKLGDKNE